MLSYITSYYVSILVKPYHPHSVRKRRDYLPRGDETFCHDGGAFELIYVQFIAYIQCVVYFK